MFSSIEKEKEMFSDLGFLMRDCSNDEVRTAINALFNKFANEENLLDYFHKNWVVNDKICKFIYSFLDVSFWFSYGRNIFINLAFLRLGM